MGKRVRTSGYHIRFSVFRSLRLPALCIFFASGAVLGHLLAQFLGADSELAANLCSYAVLNTETVASASLLSAAVLYFRFPLMVLLFSYYSFAGMVIPLVLALQGFILSFATSSLAAALGRQGVVLALATFGLRGLLTTVCALLFALVMLDRIAGRCDIVQKQRGMMIALGFLLLTVGVILELTIVPMLFTSALELLR